EATHILLGWLWHFDCKVTYDRVTNRFSFVHNGQKVVNEDHLKMKMKREKERNERKEKNE
ncbi:hypothetical protein CR513_06342, partial [Mucuna pruriens]